MKMMKLLIPIMNKSFYKYINLSFQFFFILILFLYLGYSIDIFFFKKIAVFSRFFAVNISFYLFLILITAFFNNFNFYILHSLIYMIILYNIIIDFFFKKLINFFNSPGVHKVLLSTTFRLFFSTIFIFIFLYLGVNDEILFVINFLVVYLLFIVFEISILLLNLRDTN